MKPCLVSSIAELDKYTIDVGKGEVQSGEPRLSIENIKSEAADRLRSIRVSY